MVHLIIGVLFNYLILSGLIVEGVPKKITQNVHLVVSIAKGSSIGTVAKDHSVRVVRNVFPDETHYHVSIPGERRNQTKSIITNLCKDERVEWVSHQIARHRPVRSIYFNDPFYPEQWYLHNEGQTGSRLGNDLNVVGVWDAGFRGDGVTISVLDDGLLHTHPDISANYSPEVSYDVVDLDDVDHDPSPGQSGDNSHGTSCASIIASVANNRICGVGIAHEAKIGAVRVMEGKVTDLQEALALSYAIDKVDIYSASWGPKDDGRHISGPGMLAETAFRKGIAKGRGGKGSIYVWAVGNGGHHGDNCNMDGYVASIFTIAIGALTQDGLSAVYSEGCACILASTFVGGLHNIRNVKEVIEDSSEIKVVVPQLDGSCSETFQGTSAAAPQAAGVIALALQANPELNWRDVQHLVIKSARIPNSGEKGWVINGAGHHFHLKYGFGVMDATVMISMAQKWKSVGIQKKFTIISNRTPSYIFCDGSLEIGVPMIRSSHVITHLEHVIATVDLKHEERRRLSLFLKSPSGTVSQLLTNRIHDNSSRGIEMWPFMSVHFWDENPEGVWTVLINDSSDVNCGRDNISGLLSYLSLQLLGVFKSRPDKSFKTLRNFGFNYRSRIKSYVPNENVLRTIEADERSKSQMTTLQQLND